MKKVVKKTTKRVRQKKKNPLLFFSFLVAGLVLTVAAVLSPQYLRQFAAENTAPPTFGCLHTGEADATNCGTKMGSEGELALSLNNKPFDPQTQIAYYGDTLVASTLYKNTGDQPIMLKELGIIGTAKASVVAFDSFQGATTLQPQQSVSIKNASHQFTSADPNGDWTIQPKVIDTNGQALPTEASTHVTVSAACTALRANTLTDKDKSDIQALCKNDPTNDLCSSKEYCQLFKGGSCNQPELVQETPGAQCDDSVVLDQNEQDVLEELCATYPDADACQDFCDGATNSYLCPDDEMVNQSSQSTSELPSQMMFKDGDNGPSKGGYTPAPKKPSTTAKSGSSAKKTSGSATKKKSSSKKSSKDKCKKYKSGKHKDKKKYKKCKKEQKKSKKCSASQKGSNNTCCKSNASSKNGKCVKNKKSGSGSSSSGSSSSSSSSNSSSSKASSSNSSSSKSSPSSSSSSSSSSSTSGPYNSSNAKQKTEDDAKCAPGDPATCNGTGCYATKSDANALNSHEDEMFCCYIAGGGKPHEAGKATCYVNKDADPAHADKPYSINKDKGNSTVVTVERTVDPDGTPHYKAK